MHFKVPILVIIFNRHELVQKLFNEIKKQKPKYLYISCDGPRVDKENDIELINKSKAVFDQIDWDCEIKTLYRDKNWGAGKSISDALIWFFNQVEEGVVFEEDCFPHQDFFQYCEVLLEKYRNNSEIMFIGGNNFQKQSKSEFSYYFSAYPHIWGWASWQRVIYDYSFELKNISNKDFKNVINHYNFSWIETKVWFDKFKRIQMGQINSWDYQLTYNIWSKKGISIIPQMNLVKNIGFGKDAIHCKNSKSIEANLEIHPILPIKHPKEVIINTDADSYYYNNFIKKNMTQLFWRFFLRNYFRIKFKLSNFYK